ncbi:MAG: DMT family transporter [Deltaproteobacteria bacterium]|nr:DMT family transporter [Deltaproteobacteria bacterium]
MMNPILPPILLTMFALVAFAANSILCRMALGDAAIDPASFATIRLLSGAAVLWLTVRVTSRSNAADRPGNWVSTAMLFVYAAAFSFAYVSLDTGIGALILFGFVQATMIIAGILRGERSHVWVWCGLVIALAGLAYLCLPNAEAPSLPGAFLMALAGISWGGYSLRGLRVERPAAVTADNFMKSVPLAVAFSLILLPTWNLSTRGVLLAVFSGGLTSGIGYVAWYAALRHLSATRAAILQLLVPVIAAAGGVVILSEQVTLRLALSGALILGGVGLALRGRER